MTKLTAITLAALVATASCAFAAPAPLKSDLPILVDRYYELKNPAGPVTQVPEKLKRPHIFHQIQNLDLKDIPNPQVDNVLIGL